MKQYDIVDELVVAMSSGHDPSSSPSSVHGVASSFASLEASSSTLSSELVVDRSSSSIDHEVENLPQSPNCGHARHTHAPPPKDHPP